MVIETPFNHIKRNLSKSIPSKLINKIPDKWEKIGEVLILRLPSELAKYQQQIGEKYADVLDCKTVLQDISGISGIYREPDVEIIYGDDETETVHKENGIRFRLDPQKIMFSSGNMDERIRMAKISNKNEIVVDLFAGIGYFTLPMAVYSKSKKIFACEINPVSYDYLCQNIVLNDVTANVEPLLGDNCKIAPKNIADRVIMGCIKDTYKFLPLAIDCLKDQSGFIHYHEVCPDELLPTRPTDRLRESAKKIEKELQILNYRNIKSYAPGVSHVVLDIKLE